MFARDPDAMLDMTELVPTDAIREQLHNKAACAAAKALLDARGHADAYGPDDALSRSRMLAIAKEHLPLPDLHRLDADTAAAIKRADAMTAWRIEGTLREFARFDPVNLWFDYPAGGPTARKRLQAAWFPRCRKALGRQRYCRQKQACRTAHRL